MIRFKQYINEKIQLSKTKSMIIQLKDSPATAAIKDQTGVDITEPVRYHGYVDMPDLIDVKITGKKTVKLEDSHFYIIISQNGTFIKIIAEKPTLHKLFKHAALFRGTTALKEELTLLVVELAVTKKDYTNIDFVLQELIDRFGKPFTYSFNVEYFNSSVASAKALLSSGSINDSTSYSFERQKQNISKKIYKRIDEIMVMENIKMESDSWNPADIWIFSKSIISKIPDIIADFISIEEISTWLSDSISNGEIIPVSLKNSGDLQNYTVTVIDPMHSFTPIHLSDDFSMTALNIKANKLGNKNLFQAFTVVSNFSPYGSPFSILSIRQSGSSWESEAKNPNLRLNIQGRMGGKSNHQTGSATNMPRWIEYVKKNKGSVKIYSKDGGGAYDKIPDVISDKMFKKYQAVYKKYKKFIPRAADYEKWNPKDIPNGFKQKFVVMMSLIEFIMLDPAKTIKMVYVVSKKIGAEAKTVGPHLIID